MTYDQLVTGYFWCCGIFSSGSIAWLMVRHKEHINPKVVQAALAERKKPTIPSDAQARWNSDASIVGRIGIAFIVVWVLIMFFGHAVTTG